MFILIYRQHDQILKKNRSRFSVHRLKIIVSILLNITVIIIIMMTMNTSACICIRYHPIWRDGSYYRPNEIGISPVSLCVKFLDIVQCIFVVLLGSDVAMFRTHHDLTGPTQPNALMAPTHGRVRVSYRQPLNHIVLLGVMYTSPFCTTQRMANKSISDVTSARFK